MTDDQIQKLIMKEIKKRDITYYDMVGLPDHGVDPNPEDKLTPPVRKASEASNAVHHLPRLLKDERTALCGQIQPL